MHLVWKRPDGFHGATPSDFIEADLGDNVRLWLHKDDKDQYPFQVAGGWEEKEATVRLNNLVNLVDAGVDVWVEKLNHIYDHSMNDDRKKYISNLIAWLEELGQCAKGDTWEVDIIQQAVNFTKNKVKQAQSQFLST